MCDNLCVSYDDCCIDFYQECRKYHLPWYGSTLRIKLTQDVNKCEKNVEIEKIIFSWHVA